VTYFDSSQIEGFTYSFRSSTALFVFQNQVAEAFDDSFEQTVGT
jgi:hypothetical protein